MEGRVVLVDPVVAVVIESVALLVSAREAKVVEIVAVSLVYREPVSVLIDADNDIMGFPRLGAPNVVVQKTSRAQGDQREQRRQSHGDSFPLLRQARRTSA